MESLEPFTRSPPRATVAPFSLASATWRSTFSMALGSIRGPTSTPSSMPSPTLIAAIFSVSFFENSSRMPLWTKTRLAQTQVWPMLRILETRAPSTAASTSASSKTTKGACPPSSRERRFIVSADCFMSSLPTSVEPVKESLRTRRSSMMGAVMAAGSMPATTERTPFGKPLALLQGHHGGEVLLPLVHEAGCLAHDPGPVRRGGRGPLFLDGGGSDYGLAHLLPPGVWEGGDGLVVGGVRYVEGRARGCGAHPLASYEELLDQSGQDHLVPPFA